MIRRSLHPLAPPHCFWLPHVRALLSRLEENQFKPTGRLYRGMWDTLTSSTPQDDPIRKQHSIERRTMADMATDPLFYHAPESGGAGGGSSFIPLLQNSYFKSAFDDANPQYTVPPLKGFWGTSYEAGEESLKGPTLFDFWRWRVLSGVATPGEVAIGLAVNASVGGFQDNRQLISSQCSHIVQNPHADLSEAIDLCSKLCPSLVQQGRMDHPFLNAGSTLINAVTGNGSLPGLTSALSFASGLHAVEDVPEHFEEPAEESWWWFSRSKNHALWNAFHKQNNFDASADLLRSSSPNFVLNCPIDQAKFVFLGMHGVLSMLSPDADFGYVSGGVPDSSLFEVPIRAILPHPQELKLGSGDLDAKLTLHQRQNEAFHQLTASPHRSIFSFARRISLESESMRLLQQLQEDDPTIHFVLSRQTSSVDLDLVRHALLRPLRVVGAVEHRVGSTVSGDCLRWIDEVLRQRLNIDRCRFALVDSMYSSGAYQCSRLLHMKCGVYCDGYFKQADVDALRNVFITEPWLPTSFKQLTGNRDPSTAECIWRYNRPGPDDTVQWGSPSSGLDDRTMAASLITSAVDVEALPLFSTGAGMAPAGEGSTPHYDFFEL